MVKSSMVFSISMSFGYVCRTASRAAARCSLLSCRGADRRLAGAWVSDALPLEGKRPLTEQEAARAPQGSRLISYSAWGENEAWDTPSPAGTLTKHTVTVAEALRAEDLHRPPPVDLKRLPTQVRPRRRRARSQTLCQLLGGHRPREETTEEGQASLEAGERPGSGGAFPGSEGHLAFGGDQRGGTSLP